MESMLSWIAYSVAIYHCIQRFSRNNTKTNNNLTTSAAVVASSPSSQPTTTRLQQKAKTGTETKTNATVVVVTRIHGLISDNFPSKEKISSFLTNTQQCEANGVIICIGAKTLTQLASLQDHIEQVIQDMKLMDYASVLPVYPWGYFTNSLNQAIIAAQDRHFTHILFQSFEVKLSLDSIPLLLSQFDDNTLVAGLALEGHVFAIGSHQLNGRNVPWNTAAMWDLSKLSLVGFPLVSNGFEYDRSVGGVEELPAISILQLINPSYTAKMIRNTQDPSSWNTDFGNDEARRQYHEKKMASKITRSQAQIDALGISSGIVQHSEV